MAPLREAAQEMNDWLAEEGKNLPNTLALLKAYVQILRKNVQVDRIFIGSHVIHPQAGACTWNYEAPDTYEEVILEKRKFLKLYDTLDPDEPLVKMQRDPNLQFVRYKATDEYLPKGTMTELLREKGYTDLYGVPSWFRGRFQSGITWATKQVGGFTEEEIELLSKTKNMLRMALHIMVNDLVTKTLLRTYLGSDPGSRVHRGSVDRGDGVTVRSVLWFSDIRGFTSLSSRLDRDTVIDLINDVCEVTETVLIKYGGEILKFMGDGILAVFTDPHGLVDDETQGACGVCDNATKAAKEFQVKLKELSQNRTDCGLPAAEAGIGLHYGDCSYGNVGARARLDFTVIGLSVNLASRVEGLCSKLGASVLATEEFVQRNPEHMSAWTSRGNHALKGVTGQVPVYELAGTSARMEDVSSQQV